MVGAVVQHSAEGRDARSGGPGFGGRATTRGAADGAGDPVAEPSVDRRCSRPLCEAPVEAVLVFDYQSRHVILDAASRDHDPNLLELCGMHADRFRPPQGWSVDDARDPGQPQKVAQLFN